MRKLIAAAALLAVTSAHAEELKFGDVNYFLKAGQFNVSADISSTYYKQTFEGQSTLETRGLLLETRYGFGVTDRFNLYLGLDYAYDRQVEDKTVTTNGAYNQDGLANPMLAANLRLLSQNEAALNFDLGAVARIGIEDAEEGDSVGQNKKDGNFANGRDSLELNARIGKKWNEANEWQAAVGGVYHADGEYTTNLTTGDVDTDAESSIDLFARATYQYRPVNEFMASITGQINRIGEAEEKSGGVKGTAESHYDMDFVFRAKYLILENMIANFHYGMSRNAEYDVEIGGTDNEVKRRRENFFGLGVDFLF